VIAILIVIFKLKLRTAHNPHRIDYLGATLLSGGVGALILLTSDHDDARLAAAIALILVRQRDATGLIAYDETVRAIVPPRARHGQWPLLTHTLDALKPSGRTAAELALPRVVELLKRRGMVILISDLLVDRERSLQAMRYLRHRGHQVTVFHRGRMVAELPPGVARRIGERRQLDDFAGKFRRLAPDVVLDRLAYTRADAEMLVRVFSGLDCNTPKKSALRGRTRKALALKSVRGGAEARLLHRVEGFVHRNSAVALKNRAALGQGNRRVKRIGFNNRVAGRPRPHRAVTHH